MTKVIVSHDVDHLFGKEHWFRDLIYPKMWVRTTLELIKRRITVKEWWLRNISCFRHKRHQLEAVMDSVAAYESLGFDTKVTGVNRAYQAAKHAREKAAANRLYTVDPGSYDGSVPPEQMLEMADLSKDELIAYLKARNYYMEELVEAQKKTYSVLGGILTSSKPRQ